MRTIFVTRDQGLTNRPNTKTNHHKVYDVTNSWNQGIQTVYVYNDINQILVHGMCNGFGWRLYSYSIENNALKTEDLIWALDEGHDIGDGVRYESGRFVEEPWSLRIDDKTFYPDWL